MQRHPFMLLLYTMEQICQVALNESRSFAPAGATRAGVSALRGRPSFPSWEKKAKARQGGKGPFRMGPLPPWNPQPSATTKGGLRPPVWISPQRRLVRSDIAARAPDTPRYRAAKSERTSTQSWGNPKGPRRALFGRRGEVQERGHSNCPLSCRRFCLLLPLLALRIR